MDSLSTDPGKTDSRATHDLELFDRLLGVRETLARKFRKEPYQIFKEESLIQMAMYYPQTLDDFIHIFGVGPYKQRKYGPAFTEVIQEYCQTKGILPPPIRPKQGINVSVGVPPAKAMVMGATPSPETKTETSLLPASTTTNGTSNETGMNVLRSEVGSLPFSPGGLINAYNAAIVFPQELKTVAVRGIFGMKGPKIYSGYYYDELKDEIGDQSLTLKVTPSIRDQLTPDGICTLKGYLTRKINKYGGIQVTFVATGVVCQEERTVDPEVLRRQEVLEQHQQKALPDPRWNIKSHIVQGTEPKIAAIYGETGIVDQDVTSAVGTALDHYDVTTHRGKFSSPGAIITLLCQLDSEGYDYIALIRGGGSGLEVFDDLNLAATVVAMQTPVLTALGHEVDHPFLERVACHAFTTPTAFGTWLKAMVEETFEELSRSKAAALNEVQKQYNEMVKRLEQQLEDAKKAEGQQVEIIKDLQGQIKEAGRSAEEVRKDLEKTYEERLKDLQQQVENGNKAVEQQRTDAQKTEERQAELIKDLQKQMESSNKSTDDLRKDIEKGYEGRVTDLKQQLDLMQRASEQSSKTILELQRQIEVAGKSTADIRQDVESIYRDRLSAAEQKHTESQRVVEEQTATLNELRGQVAESGSNRMVIIAAIVSMLLGLGIGAGVMTLL
ncbi:exodeoxyribonuclease VII large subunit [Methanoculleus horonobensis]|uniref:exodeoxyribonuclease VII large subunit n=1 Tax=Methanoculleus horonobensis TaxID=528314 RepID=UPI00082E7DF0|nr:exodeoxyribonuclease VII large subunit [Methanoculleus horonobensis]